MVSLHQMSGLSEYDGGYLEQALEAGVETEVTHGQKKAIPVGLLYWLTVNAGDTTAVSVRFVEASATTITIVATGACTIRFIPLYP
jgi:hypothetical protein